MRKPLKILFILSLLTVFALFLILPVQLHVSSSILIENHKRIVYKEIYDVEQLKRLLELKQGGADRLTRVQYSRKKKGKGAFLRWKQYDEACFLQIVGAVQDSLITLDVDFSEYNYDNKFLFQINPIEYKQTLLACEYSSRKILNPIKRLYYLMEKEQYKANLDRLLQYVKEKAESQEHYRIILSDIDTVYINDVLLCFERKISVSDLEQAKRDNLRKVSKIVSQYKEILPLDTVKNSFVRYTDWNEKQVLFDVCVPLIHSPKLKEIFTFLLQCKVDSAKNKYFATSFLGREKELASGWDSLFQIISKKGIHKSEGFPIERLVCDTIDDFGRKKWQLLIPID